MQFEERDAAITKGSKRLQRGWATALFIMAVALPPHAFGLKDEPFWQPLLLFGLAALIVIKFLLSWRDSNRGVLGDEESKSAATDDADSG